MMSTFDTSILAASESECYLYRAETWAPESPQTNRNADVAALPQGAVLPDES